MKGMIFAAGIGSRLKPFTDYHPKALVEIGGRPILQNVIERMKAIGISDITVNVHHFANQIIDFLNANDNFGIDIHISDEQDKLLETGGGILAARRYIDGDDALLHNADILSDIDLKELVSAHDHSADATLLVSRRQSSRQLYFDGNMNLKGWQNLSTGQTKPGGFIPDDSLMPLAFSGIQIISPSIFKHLDEYSGKNGEAFSVIPFYVSNLATLKIKGFKINGDYKWFDIGKPETLEKAIQAAKP